MRITRLMASGLVGAALLLMSAQPGLAKKCGDAPGDAAAVQAARADVDANCDCEGAASHGAYVQCAAERANFLSSNAGGNVLPKSCKGAVIKCAARSTCGKSGSVTCCRTTARGKTMCSIKRDAAHCRAPRGGSASTGTGSCCDNCGGVCGNGTVEPPEECDPPASSCTGAFVGETCQGDCTCGTTSTTIATTSTTVATTSTTVATTSTTVATTSTTIPVTSTTTSSTTTTTIGSPSGAFLD